MNHRRPPLSISYEYVGGEEDRLTGAFDFILNKIAEEWRYAHESHFFIEEEGSFVELKATDKPCRKSLLTRKGNIIYAYL